MVTCGVMLLVFFFFFTPVFPGKSKEDGERQEIPQVPKE